ncbi:beta-methylgalactoside transporter [Pseudoflavonifractor sp. 60]|uniref:galactose/methyl galactoside ABC transporter permease MglC n=1 Tax=Pseudoflavonifractor sp. 60 TaxID=2304576 RepID=UPI00136FECE4|nr:beta-methylgalactoside transporter [Pseudoflavonifractor sp. 60]NBI65611.1 beta-methylgalactoside transporter [Pseudoflavonifractor sp. 60]
MEKKSSFNVVKFMSDNAIILLVLLLALFTGLTSKNFFTTRNFSNLVINMSPRFIIACGVSGCLITKGTDLSAGRQVGLAACLSAMLLQSVDYSARMLPWLPDVPVWAALIAVVVVMGIIGAINGCVIAFLKVPPFIATLGMQTIVYGACQIITNNQPMGGFKSSYSNVALGSFMKIPYLAFFAVAVGAYFLFLYNKTRHGKYMYAIGGNESAAQVAGVNVVATLIRIYLLAGMMYGLAGFLVGAKAGGASTATGFGYELEAIAACTIGGVSANGGVGRVSGILVGVLVFEALKICLQFLGVDPAYTFIAQGLVIIVAVALDLRKYLAKK